MNLLVNVQLTGLGEEEDTWCQFHVGSTLYISLFQLGTSHQSDTPTISHFYSILKSNPSFIPAEHNVKRSFFQSIGMLICHQVVVCVHVDWRKSV